MNTGNAKTAVLNYIEAWNRRDPAAVLDALLKEGTYTDPSTPGPISGQAFATYIYRLISNLPDLHFEIVSLNESERGRVILEWHMKGTRTTPFPSFLQTGNVVDLPGLSVIQVSGNKISCVQAYFDNATLLAQLGLNMFVLPVSSAPVAAASYKAIPAGFNITWIDDETPEDETIIHDFARETAIHMSEMPNFTGSTVINIRQHDISITAWDKPEIPRSEVLSETLCRAMQHNLEEPVQEPIPSQKLHSLWFRCRECGKMIRASDEDEHFCDYEADFRDGTLKS
jgi:steroid delta-isomerase-like uncharacterized protein